MNRPEITEDTTIVIDFDSIAFGVASAAEKVSIKVSNKETGEEVLKGYPQVSAGEYNPFEDFAGNPPEPFKNRTDLWGRSKKNIGGWLAEVNRIREENGEVTYTKDDFTVEDVYTPEPLQNALHSAKMVVESILNHLGSRKIIGLLGEGENFRHNILLPEQYKSNRKDTHRPIHLKAVREYLAKRYPTTICESVEADDVINMWSFRGYLDYKKTGNLTYCVVGIDKDMRQEVGMLFNPTKVNGEFIYPEPEWIDGIGDLELIEKGKQKKIKGTGFKFLMYQVLCGDDSDGYSPTKHFGIRFGDAGAFKVFEGKETPKEILEAVLEQYDKWFPEGVKFTAFNGKEQDISSVEWANRMFQAAWMLRYSEDKTNLYTYLDKFGVEYERG